MQVKTSKIAWICLVLFGGIGTFQRVTSEKIKKSLSFELASRVVRETPRSALSPSRELTSHRRTFAKFRFDERKYTKESRIRQGFVGCNRRAASERFISPMAWSDEGNERGLTGTAEL
jgi:hypothetical protein